MIGDEIISAIKSLEQLNRLENPSLIIHKEGDVCLLEHGMPLCTWESIEKFLEGCSAKQKRP